VTTLVVLAAVLRQSVATDRLFFKDKTGDRETSVYGIAGEDIVLECEVGGSSSPTVHWLYRGIRIQQVHAQYTCHMNSLYCVYSAKHRT